jgi:hypothetical protein
MTEDTAAPRQSLFGDLAARRQQLVEENILTLPVRGWKEPEVFVQYQPIKQATILAVGEKIDKAPKRERSEAILNANADALIEGCVGVFARMEEEPDTQFSFRPGDPRGKLTRFDPALAEALGMDPETTKSREVLRELFIVEGDILMHANALAEHSGYADVKSYEALSGE